jgi:hypothetical protein
VDFVVGFGLAHALRLLAEVLVLRLEEVPLHMFLEVLFGLH